MAGYVQDIPEPSRGGPVKRIDYYAPHEPWKMPKWVGLTLGGVFTVVAVTCAVLIVHMTRPAHAATPPQVAAAAVAAPETAAPVATAPPVQTAQAPTTVASVAKVSAKHGKHAKVAHGKATRVASIGHAKSSAILARHDSASKRKQKDDLDRLLGL
jgi:hypothetical protein